MRAERSVFKWVQPVVDRIVSLGHQAGSLCLLTTGWILFLLPEACVLAQGSEPAASGTTAPVILSSAPAALLVLVQLCLWILTRIHTLPELLGRPSQAMLID